MVGAKMQRLKDKGHHAVVRSLSSGIIWKCSQTRTPLASNDLFDGVWVNERVRVRTVPKAACGREVLHPCLFNPAKFPRTLSGW